MRSGLRLGASDAVANSAATARTTRTDVACWLVDAGVTTATNGERWASAQ